MKNFFIKKNKGFTLIEMMIAVALFSVIMVIGIGAVLSANNAHKKTQNVRAILDNLSFVMEEMSRNLRTGTNYHCDIRVGTISDPLDGLACPSIAFESATGTPGVNDQWQYYIGSVSGVSTNGLYKQSPATNNAPIALTTPDINISPNRSGFTVLGACSKTICPTDSIQPKVIIRLSGSITYQNTKTPFDLQTTVSQRVYDN